MSLLRPTKEELDAIIIDALVVRLYQTTRGLSAVKEESKRQREVIMELDPRLTTEEHRND